MTEHLCITCPARGRDIPDLYETANVCASCRNWLAGLPADICRLWARLGDHTIEPDGPWYVDQYRNGRWVREPGHDPVTVVVPTMASGARLGGDQVTGSRETRLPINEDMVDLAARAGGLTLTIHGRTWWRDQTGHLSVAMVLDLIAREWADALRHRLPVPTVPVLAAWIGDRMEWACDRYAGIDADATELRRLRSVLRGVLGEHEPRPEAMGAPCPGCDMLTLVRRPGEDRVDCATVDCARVLTAEEYVRWSGMVLAGVRERMVA